VSVVALNLELENLLGGFTSKSWTRNVMEGRRKRKSVNLARDDEERR